MVLRRQVDCLRVCWSARTKKTRISLSHLCGWNRSTVGLETATTERYPPKVCMVTRFHSACLLRLGQEHLHAVCYCNKRSCTPYVEGAERIAGYSPVVSGRKADSFFGNRKPKED